MRKVIVPSFCLLAAVVLTFQLSSCSGGGGDGGGSNDTTSSGGATQFDSSEVANRTIADLGGDVEAATAVLMSLARDNGLRLTVEAIMAGTLDANGNIGGGGQVSGSGGSSGGTGAVSVSLRWDADADLDLHVKDPCGNEITWFSPQGECQGKTGTQDNDDVGGPASSETVSWPENGAPTGEYEYWAFCFGGCDNQNVEYTLVDDVEGFTTLNPGTLARNSEESPHFRFTVSGSARQGRRNERLSDVCQNPNDELNCQEEVENRLRDWWRGLSRENVITGTILRASSHGYDADQITVTINIMLLGIDDGGFDEDGRIWRCSVASLGGCSSSDREILDPADPIISIFTDVNTSGGTGSGEGTGGGGGGSGGGGGGTDTGGNDSGGGTDTDGGGTVDDSCFLDETSILGTWSNPRIDFPNGGFLFACTWRFNQGGSYTTDCGQGGVFTGSWSLDCNTVTVEGGAITVTSASSMVTTVDVPTGGSVTVTLTR